MGDVAKFRFGIQLDKPTPRGLFVEAFTVGDDINKNWDSNRASSIIELNNLVYRVSGDRQITIAVPRMFGPYFTPRISKYENVMLTIGETSDKQSDHFGQYYIELKDVEVVKTRLIYRRKGLPIPSEALLNFQGKISGWAAFIPIAVTLLVEKGEIYIPQLEP